MFKVALKNILGHKLRTLFTAVAVALGVGFMSGTFVLTDTVSASFDTIFTEAYAGLSAQVRGKTAFEASNFDGGDQRPDIDPALTEAVADVDGVAAAEPVVQSIGAVLDDEGKPVNQGGAPSFGANWTGNPAIDVFTIDDGRAPEGPDEAVIDTTLAEAGNFEPGDAISVQTLKGIVDLELVGIIKYGKTGNLGGASFVMMDTPAAIETFGFNGQVQGIAVVADEGVTQQEVVDRIEPVLPDGVEVITADAAAQEAKDLIGSFVGTIRTFLTIFALIALAAGSFLIYNTFGIIIGQRVRELALLRALGSSRRQVMASVVVEAAVIGLVASILGLLGGVVLAVILQTILATVGLGESGVAPVVSPSTLIWSVVVGVLVSVLCSVVPAWRASRIPPVAALREASTDDQHRSIIRLVIGVLLVLAGIGVLVSGANGSGNGALVATGLGTVLAFAGTVVLGPYIVPPLTGFLGLPLRLFGVAGALGRDNARRNPKRSSGTAAALMLSVTLISFIAVFAQSFGKSINAAIDEQLRADIEVVSAGLGFPSLNADLVDDLAARDEVAAVSGVQRGTVEIDGTTRPVYGVRFAGLTDLYDLGEVQGDLDSLGAGEIAVDVETARLGLWNIGKELPVTWPDGTQGTVTIGALYDDGSIIAQNSDGHFLVSDQDIRTHFPALGQLISRIDVKAADGVTVEGLRAVAEQATESVPSAEVRDKGEIKEANNRQLAFSLALFFALLGLALVIGALGVAITLALSVFERTREIGLLRAVGGTRRQIVTAISCESVVITLLGTVLGLVIGVAGGSAIMLAQRDEFETLRIYLPPWFVIGVLILATLIGMGASVIPGFRAARMDVLDAVTVE